MGGRWGRVGVVRMGVLVLAGCAVGESGVDTTADGGPRDTGAGDDATAETTDAAKVDSTADAIDTATDTLASDAVADGPTPDATPDATDAATDAPADAIDTGGDAGTTLGLVASITAGTYHSCARLTDGSVKCWGYNFYGQVGDGTTTNQAAPRTVLGLLSGTLTALRVTAGGNHTCARLSDETVRCWGSSAMGQVGDGTLVTKPSPVSPTGLTKVAEIVAGQDHTCARLTDATVKCWGSNAYGQLGIGTLVDKSIPTAIAAITNAAQVSAGARNTCLRLATGTVSCFGDNAYGQIGDGTLVDRTAPKAVTGVTGATDLAVGANHACALIGTGATSSVKCWGYNFYGQLGDGTTTNRSTAVTVSGLTNVVEITAGDSHTCARLADSSVSAGAMGSTARSATRRPPTGRCPPS
ncbi:MAG: hypothetical protein IPJ34_10605 [Myxococcales bacterium]|nr:hypothetical protein [Myxococcales bacterium]